MVAQLDAAWIDGMMATLCCTLRDAKRNVGTTGIGNDTSFRGFQDEIHVLHGDGTEQHLVAEHDGTGVATAAIVRYLDGPDVRAQQLLAVGHNDFAFLEFFKLELQSDVRWDAQMQCPGICQRTNLDWREFADLGVTKGEGGVGETHGPRLHQERLSVSKFARISVQPAGSTAVSRWLRSFACLPPRLARTRPCS